MRSLRFAAFSFPVSVSANWALRRRRQRPGQRSHAAGHAGRNGRAEVAAGISHSRHQPARAPLLRRVSSSGSGHEGDRRRIRRAAEQPPHAQPPHGRGARVGYYKLDSSNFIGEEGFRGFIGSLGSVGIDRDYDSLRQDLWIATDQAFKEAVETYSRKQAYLSSLARQSDIDDFSRVPSRFSTIDPLVTPDWSNRNWEQEARQTSSALRAFPEVYESRVTYYLVYCTEYLLTSEGTEIRTNHSFAAIEAGMNTLADDGMALNHLYSTYAPRPGELPNVDAVRKSLNVAGSELMAMRAAQPAQDYTGPVLFEARAAAALLAQILGPAMNGAASAGRVPAGRGTVDGQSWGQERLDGKVGARVLPPTVSADRRSVGQGLSRHAADRHRYAVDDEGVRAEKVTVVENGKLKDLLMSRRPGHGFGSSPTDTGAPRFLTRRQADDEQSFLHVDGNSFASET